MKDTVQVIGLPNTRSMTYALAWASPRGSLCAQCNVACSLGVASGVVGISALPPGLKSYPPLRNEKADGKRGYEEKKGIARMRSWL